VPSIVFGVFGLGFYVYTVGGTLDRLFFPEALPTPTFGTGGILWCAMTLAILTIPVVVVATEEALAAVPAGMRHASLALGATKWQTTWRVVLPAAAPGILTGLILAMARGTGEVAPLMIVGVVKLAPNLPLDGVFPYLHLERKIMHLGFHLYDVGFQSPNVEAARPLWGTLAVGCPGPQAPWPAEIPPAPGAGSTSETGASIVSGNAKYEHRKAGVVGLAAGAVVVSSVVGAVAVGRTTARPAADLLRAE